MAAPDVVGRIRQFNRFYTAFLGVLDRHFLQSPYSLIEVRILYEIRHGTDSVARDIVVSLGVDRGYLSRIIDSFTQRGILRASASAQDKRRRIITLTRKGKRIFDELEARSEQSVARAIAGLSGREREGLAEMMEKIQALLTRGE